MEANSKSARSSRSNRLGWQPGLYSETPSRRPNRCCVTNAEFVIWAAGFFDGEGHISLSPASNGSYNVAIVVGQKSLKPLLMLQKRWGGRITPNGTVFNWQINRKELVKAFLDDVRPYLYLKDTQADVMYEYLRLTGHGRDTRLELVDKMREARRVSYANGDAANPVT